jgi:hypothetical protein
VQRHADFLGTADVLAQLRRMEDEPAAVVVEDDLVVADPQEAMDDMGILARLPGARARRGTHGHEPVFERKDHARKGVGARWGDEISSGCLPMKSAMDVMWGLSELAPAALAPRSTRAAGTPRRWDGRCTWPGIIPGKG